MIPLERANGKDSVPYCVQVVEPHESSSRWARPVALLVFAATLVQLAVAAFVPNLDQFEGKGFAARLVAYPIMMLALPVGYWLWSRRQVPRPTVPWAAYALIWLPFLIDVTGNAANLYDSISWWDDANHFVNWFLLSAGIGLVLSRTSVRQPWVMLWLTAGFGALLAIVWEVGEYYAFIRYGSELDGAYEDTLGDEALGAFGALLAGLWMFVRMRSLSREA